ncbi:MAG: hypothetical protein ABI348_03845 [Nitrososphaera sp.]
MPNKDERVWFSHWTKEYQVRQAGKKRVFEWLQEKPAIKLDWDNCTVDVVGRLDGMHRLVVRSKTLKNSQYMGSIPVQLRFMLMYDIDPEFVQKPALDRNHSLASSARKGIPESVRRTPHDRWVMRLGGDAEVWERTRRGEEIKSSRVWCLYERIITSAKSGADAENVFRATVEEIDKVVPIVYQPAVDSLGNFLREMHCGATIDGDVADVEVSLVFNNEHLRKFALADGLYRWLRKLLYGRSIDIETFRIHFVRDKEDENYFIFQSIYSGDYGLVYDTIHLDPLPERHGVEYYFEGQRHPVVFINTSNHAMAGHDNNPQLWKWEYVQWIKKSPVVLGTKTRSELDRQFRSIFFGW